VASTHTRLGEGLTTLPRLSNWNLGVLLLTGEKRGGEGDRKREKRLEEKTGGEKERRRRGGEGRRSPQFTFWLRHCCRLII